MRHITKCTVGEASLHTILGMGARSRPESWTGSVTPGLHIPICKRKQRQKLSLHTGSGASVGKAPHHLEGPQSPSHQRTRKGIGCSPSFFSRRKAFMSQVSVFPVCTMREDVFFSSSFGIKRKGRLCTAKKKSTQAPEELAGQAPPLKSPPGPAQPCRCPYCLW